MSKSFSLIELLVVVTIISVLTGAALPFVNEYVEQSRRAKANADLENFSRAINAYETVEAKDYTDTSGNTLVGRFIQKMPVDPWGTPYSFASASDVNGATVACAGPDRILGSSDDMAKSYKGKLAMVSARWVDTNSDGAISQASVTVRATDVLIVRFNRGASTTPLYNPANFGISDVYTGGPSTAGFGALFGRGSTTAPLSTTNVSITSDRKQVTYWVFMRTDNGNATTSMKIGSSTIKIIQPAAVVDLKGNPSVNAPVTITAD